MPYLFIRIAVGEVSPVFVSWLRLVVAASLLLPLAASRGSLLAALARWRWVLLLGAVQMALAWTLIPVAERTLPSSLTAIIIAGVPIVVTLINFRRDRPAPLRIAGLLLGLIGVAILVGLDLGVQPAQLFAVGCLMVVLISYAAGPVMTSRRLGGVDPVAVSGLATGFAALILTPFAAFQLPAQVPSVAVVASLAILAILCSAAALPGSRNRRDLHQPSGRRDCRRPGPARACGRGIVGWNGPHPGRKLAGDHRQDSPPSGRGGQELFSRLRRSLQNRLRRTMTSTQAMQDVRRAQEVP